MKLRSTTIAAAAALTLGATFALGSWSGAMRVRERDEWTDGRLLSTAIDSVRANALDSLPSEELVRRAVTGMLRELHDPYAAMLRPEGYKRYRGSLHGEGVGLGLAMRSQAGVVSIARVAEGSPAALAGIRRGDRVISVNGVPIREGWGRRSTDTSTAPLDMAHVLLWRAPHGDTVSVGIHSADWHVPAVSDVVILADSVGYVRLNSITSRSADELDHAVVSLQQHGARSLLLDLRGNGGGLFDEGVKAAGLFLPKNTLVASLSGRGGVRPEEHRSSTSRFPTLPLTLLVDAGTASAAEVIAAALQEHNRALLVGAPTYGKGVVQRVVKLTPDISLRLTTARWLTPLGNALERRQGIGAAARGGLQPDVLLDDASRSDPLSLPRDWGAPASLALSQVADSLSLRALREGWATTPVSILEARLRLRAAQIVPPSSLSALPRAEWVAVATRIATARVLEITRETEPLLRYSIRTDAALRAGLDVLAPAVDISPVLPSVLPLLARDGVPRRRAAQ